MSYLSEHVPGWLIGISFGWFLGQALRASTSAANWLASQAEIAKLRAALLKVEEK